MSTPDDIEKNDSEVSPYWSLLPFGSAYHGYKRGKPTDRGLEGAIRGTGGGLVGAGVGGLAASLPANLYARHLSKGRYIGGSEINKLRLLKALQFVGGQAGNVMGTDWATRGMVEPSDPKTAALKLFGLEKSAAVYERL